MTKQEMLKELRKEIVKYKTAYIHIYNEFGLCWVAFVVNNDWLGVPVSTENLCDTIIFLMDKEIKTIVYEKSEVIKDEVKITIRLY